MNIINSILNETIFNIINRNKTINGFFSLNHHRQHYIGYKQVALNLHKFNFHRHIALQFIPNDDLIKKYIVDHKNRNKLDNHLSNLRWSTSNRNYENKSSHRGIVYQYVDDIPDDSAVIDSYNYYKFDDDKYYYWFDEDKDEDVFFAKINDNIYRKLHKT